MSCKCQADDTGGEASGFPQSWSLANVTPLQRRGMGIPPPGHRTEPGSVLQERAMQDHGAIIGPQYALAWVRAEENGLQSNTTAASSSKQQQAAARSSNREGVASRVGSHVGRDTAWFAGPGLQPSPQFSDTAGWRGVLRDEGCILPRAPCRGAGGLVVLGPRSSRLPREAGRCRLAMPCILPILSCIEFVNSAGECATT